MSETVTVSVVGVGINKTITVEDGTPLAGVIAEARGAAVDDSVQVRLNGQEVDAENYTPTEGDTLVVVPPAVKLGA